MLGELISGGLSLLGGLFQDKATAKANAENIKYQKQFAQEGIQWRVADAQKAGVHPLYALGANTTSFSPSVIGETGVGASLASAGQDIGRAVAAKTATDEFTKTTQALTLQRMGLENDLLASQIAKINQPATPPMWNNTPFIDGEGDVVNMGVPVAKNPAFDDAQVIQNRYGEPAEWMYFPMVAGADLIHNAVQGANIYRDTVAKLPIRGSQYYK